MATGLPLSVYGVFSQDRKFDSVRIAVDKEIAAAGGQRPKQAIILDEAKTFKVVMDVTGYTQRDLTVTVNGLEITVVGQAETNVGGKKGKKSFQKAFGVPSDCRINEATGALSADGMLVFSMPRDGGVGGLKKTTKKVTTTTINIESKGEFNQDSFFSDVKSIYEKSLKDTQSKYPDTQSIKDEQTLLQTLRQKNTQENKQVEAVGDDEKNHNVVIDVKGYKKESLTITVTNETHTINIEGNEQGRYTSKSFKKTYVLNETFNIKESQTGLSSDGILALKVPKQGTTEVKKTVKKVKKVTKTETEDKPNVTQTKTTQTKPSTVTEDDDGCTIDINVSGYTENDLSIDMTGDNELTVSGQTELVIDGKNAKKKFTKPYTIPDGLDLSKIRVVVDENQINISIPKIGASTETKKVKVKKTVTKTVQSSG